MVVEVSVLGVVMVNGETASNVEATKSESKSATTNVETVESKLKSEKFDWWGWMK